MVNTTQEEDAREKERENRERETNDSVNLSVSM